MVKNEFVPYELALRLKKLGFKEPCFFAFDNCNMRCTDLRTNEQKFNGVNYNSSSYTSQPTYNQVIGWFIEEFGLYSSIVPKKSYPDGYINGFEWVVDIYGGNGEEIGHNGIYTYQEAKRACVEKLIEIAEEDNNNLN